MIKNNNVVCIIPARGGSKGIKNKNLVNILNKPLIAWTLEQAKSSKYIDDIYVSTDSEKIKNVCDRYDIGTIKRPKNISGDNDSSEEAILNAMDIIEDKKGNNIDLIVFLQCTSPLRLKNDIDLSIELFFQCSYDSLISVTKLEDLTLWSKKNKKLESLNFDYKNRGMRQNRSENYIENGSIYLFKPSILKKKKNRLGGKIGMYEMKFWQTWELDTYEEIDLIEYLIKKHVVLENKIKIKKENLELIAFDFDGVLTDNKVLVHQNGEESVFANRSDGLAINILNRIGIPVIVISTEKNSVVRKRCEKIGVRCYNGVENKLDALKKYCDDNKFSLNKVMFVGNDLNDKEVMLNVGYPVCPYDANPSIIDISIIRLNTIGGSGVVLELCKLLGVENK